MELISAAILSISDAILLISQIAALSLIAGNYPSPRKIIAAIATVLTLSFCSELLINSEVTSVSQYIILLINNFSGCILSMYLMKSFTIRNTLLLMILQIIGPTINSSIYFIIPTNIRDSIPLFYSVMLLAVRIIILIVIFLLKKQTRKFRQNNIMISIPISVYALVLISILIENGLVELINYDTSKTDLKLQTVQLFLTLLIICISATILSLIVNVIYKNYYGAISDMLEKQVNIQLDHYTKMEKMNSEIRKFKHDYNNHICCISGLLRAQKYDEIKDYIEAISGQMPSGEFMFRTGNYIADAILSDKQEQAATNSITIKFDGHIPPDINNTDLCIILSNALDNSIEACREVKGNKVIFVYGNFQQGYFTLVVKNPTINAIPENNLPSTTKSDKLHHGFGLSNIEGVVNKYDGKMQLSCVDGVFTLSIALNNSYSKITADT